MEQYVYIMADTKMVNLHCGFCSDLIKVIKMYHEIPTLFFKPNRQNVLVYLEQHSSKEKAKTRLDEIISMTKPAKIALIESVNPKWTELVPGQNIEL